MTCAIVSWILPTTNQKPLKSAFSSSKSHIAMSYSSSIISFPGATDLSILTINHGRMPTRKNQQDHINGNLVHINAFYKEKPMQKTDMEGIFLPSSGAYARLLKGCIELKATEEGKAIHAHVIKTGLQSDVFVCNNILTMYAKCGHLEDACQVFDKMPERNTVSWTAMMTGYAQSGNGEETLQLFCQLRRAGLKVDQFAFGIVLSVCSKIAAWEQGKQIHKQVVQSGFELDVYVGSALIDVYVKCGKVGDARRVFDVMPEKTVVSWTSMISGYVQNNGVEEAFELFNQMKLAGLVPNLFTFTSVLQACAITASLEEGRQIHNNIIKAGLDSDVVGSSLVDMYSKCKRLKDACQVFDEMSKRNLVSWNVMIAGYAQNGYSEETLKLFRKMLQGGIEPDNFTFTGILSACANLASLGCGKQVHALIINIGTNADVLVGNSVVDMYAKCGCLPDAHQMFEEMQERDIVSWNTIITGYARHGYGKRALALFQEMQQEGIKPNHITFVSVLSACSRVGLVDEGHRYFDSMYRDHGITPSIEHYACMIDLLGRAGQLGLANGFINLMPFKPNAFVLRNLLGACRIHSNIDLAKHVAKSIIELEPHDPAAYVALSNIYAAAGIWDNVGKVRKLMKDRGVRKDIGCSWIEVKNKVHKFVARDRSHPQSEEIYTKLEELTRELKAIDYEPDTSFVLHDVEKEQKEEFLCQHSEKLAIAFGLISTQPGMHMRIMKNLRVCGDCHTFMKFVSNFTMRELVMRDASRFHHFKDGVCSCGDYW